MIFNSSSEPTPRICRWQALGLVDYQTAWDYQRSLVAARMADPMLEDVLLLLEHPPVYTLGTGSTQDFLKFDPENAPYEIHRIERGGEVTYHCPGQLVAYPILNLRYYQQDLHWYLRQLEEVILQILQSYHLPAERLSGLTGVWVKGHKIAAIGIKVSRWITMHGFAINVCPDLTGFTRIVPCGIADKPVGSLSQFLPAITVKQVQDDIVQSFAQVFQVNLLPKSKLLKKN
jgi:lipoyl(octanoyl) transferase